MNLKLSAAGFALQSAKGAAEAQPAWWGPVGGGGLVSFELEQTEDELTSARVAGVGEFRESIAITAGYETRLWPASFAGLLYAILGARQTTTAPRRPTPTPWTPAALAALVHRPARRTPSASRRRTRPPTRSRSSGRATGSVKATVAWAGLGVAWSPIAYVPVSDETDEGYLKGINLTSVIDLDGSGYDGGAVLQGGLVEIKRNLAPDPEVRAARAGRPLRGCLRVRRRTQGAGAGPAAGTQAVDRRRGRLHDRRRRAPHAHVRRCPG